MTDDVACVVGCRAPLSIECEALPHRLAMIRRELGTWLKGTAVHDELGAYVVLATNEACTNCVEHAYHAVHPGTMCVNVEHRGDEIYVRVTDFGSWKTPDPNVHTRGRGLLLLQSLSEHGDVTTTESGTTVHMRFRAGSASRSDVQTAHTAVLRRADAAAPLVGTVGDRTIHFVAQW